jgi:hypothetical protein
MKIVISLRITAEYEVNVVTMFHSSLLNGNVLTGHSCVADGRAAEWGYFNSQQLTERERAHWTFSAADGRAAECGYFNSQQLTERERAHWTFFCS